MIKPLICLLICGLFSNALYASELDLSKIDDILEQPSQKVDLAVAKLVIDQMIDPGIDIQSHLHKLDEMKRQIKAIAADKSSDMDIMLAIRTYLYEKGAWNNNQPFQYDFSDPLGQRIANKLLPNFIASKQGNCVSMPLLFVILGQKLGINITASTAPLHIFARFTDRTTGHVFNIEATNGGNPARDVWYIQQSFISAQAIENKIYLQSLSKKETIAVMLMTLAEHYGKTGKNENVLKVADLALKHYPNFVYAMIQKGNAYSRLLNKRIAKLREKGYTSANLPANEKALLDSLYRNNLAWFEKAELLGWRQPSPASEQAYLEAMKQQSSQ